MSYELEFIGPNDKPALVALSTPEWLDAARNVLTEIGYKVHAASNHDDFISRFGRIQYQVVLIEELFASNAPEDNLSLQHIQQMPMNQRRHTIFVLLGNSFGTLSAIQAFQQSVHAVVNRDELALLGPVTNQVKGYPYEVELPEGLAVKGVVLSDQVKNLDWKQRKAAYICEVSHEVLDDVIRLYRKESCDYATNTQRQTFPDGLDVEVFSFAALERTWREAAEPADREHVTTYIRTRPRQCEPRFRTRHPRLSACFCVRSPAFTASASVWLSESEIALLTWSGFLPRLAARWLTKLSQ